MKKYYVLLTGTMLLGVLQTKAQTKIGAAGAPDGSAMLEITSGAANNKGLLLPRMTTAQRNTITSPAKGLMIFNTTTNQAEINNGTPTLPVWAASTATATGWNTIGNTGTTPATNFIGTIDNQPLTLRTNNTEKVRVTETGDVGIGTNAPAARLHVDTGGLMITNGTTVLTNPAIQVVNNGGGPGNNDNIVINSFGLNTQPSIGTQSSRGTFSAPQNSQAGDNIGNFFFNARANGVVTNANVIRGVYLGNGTTNKSRMDFYTSNAHQMTIDSNGNVGIGTITPAYALHVIGDINASGNVRANGVALTSDARLKRNITNSNYGLNTIMDLRPVVYDKKNSIQETNYNRHEIGFIAQEIAKVLPSIVTEGKDVDKILAVSYTELIPVLTKAIQEQQAQIEALKSENQKLKGNEAVTAQLMERVKQMEQMMGIKEIEGTSKVADK